MTKIDIIKRLASGHRKEDYVAIHMSLDEAAELIKSLSSQIASQLRRESDRGRIESRFRGEVYEAGDEAVEYLGGHFSIMVDHELRCAHAACSKTFKPATKDFASGYRRGGYVCADHDEEKQRKDR